MRRATKFCVCSVALCFAAIAALLFFASAFRIDSGSSAALSDADYVSVEHYTEPDGTVAAVYASGDQYYNYLHDGKGRILVPDEAGYLCYAQSDAGSPVASATRWNASDPVVSRTRTMTASDLDLQNNPHLLNKFDSLGADTDVSALSVNNPETDNQNKIVNSVVFLRFADETGNSVTDSVFHTLTNTEGETDTLNDYFETVSANTFGFYNVLPYTADGELFVYTAPKPISYYRSVPSGGVKRQKEEGILLGAALAAAKPYLETAIRDSGYSTDADGDNSVDSVTFFVLSDEPGNDAWNTLLWPHQWSFTSVSVTETLGGVAADRYLFMFTSSTRFFSVLTHEMGHVVGAPDLYHYSDTSSVPVGYYDNMASSGKRSPNFWLTAMREKYMADAVKEWQVAEISENWDGYTLKAVSAAMQADTLAYKIRLNATEWLYLEYRSSGVGRYDNNFDYNSDSATSGLVVYRVKEGVNGNENGVKPGTSYARNPDEIYVFRNNAIAAAALNVSNPTTGSASNTALYRDGNLYTTDGRNSKIVISVKAFDSATQSVRFEVHKEGFPSYGGGSAGSAMVGLSTDPYTESTKPIVSSSLYGAAPNFTVYPVFLSGTTRTVGETPLPQNLFTVLNFNPFDESLKAQSASVQLDADAARAAGYPVAEGTVFPALSFITTVEDFDERLVVLAPGAGASPERFMLGTQTGFVRSFQVVTAMGKTREYSADDPETAQALRYALPETPTVGTATIKVSFQSLTAELTVEFYDRAIALRYAYYDEQGALITAFQFGSTVEALPFHIVYASGETQTVSISAVSLGFNTANYKLQTIAAHYPLPDGTTLTTDLTLQIYKVLSSYRLLKDGAETSADSAVRFGESFYGKNYTLSAMFTDGTTQNFALTDRIETKPMLAGETLKIVFPEIVFDGKSFVLSFKINVPATSADEILKSGSRTVRIDQQNRLIVTEAAMTEAEFLKLLSVKNYLQVDFLAGTSGGVSGGRVTVAETASGIALAGYTYTVVLNGDANGDNRVDQDDIDALATLYLQKESALKHATGDTDGDGVYTLFDFSSWLRRLTGEAETNAA